MEKDNYEIICLTNPNECNKLAFDVRIDDRWYLAVFKDGYMQSVEKSTTKGTIEQINANKLDWWDVDVEIENLIDSIISQWYKDNNIDIPKFNIVNCLSKLSEFDLNSPKIETIELTKEKMMIYHLLALLIENKNQEVNNCIDVYVQKIKENKATENLLFDEIDRMISKNIMQIEDKYIDKEGLQNERNYLRLIKETILRKIS